MKASKYIQPTVEVAAVHAAVGMCQPVSKFGELTPGGGTSEHNPITDGL